MRLDSSEIDQLLTLDDKARGKRIAEKLSKHKPLTASERAYLASQKSGIVSDPNAGYVQTWDELADAISIDERSLFNFRQRHAPIIKARKSALTRADGRHCVAEWLKLADELGELKGRGVNNPDSDYVDERALRLRERQLLVQKAEHKLAVEKGEVLPLSEYQTALRITVAAFDAALVQIPARSAEAIVQITRTAVVSALKAALTEKQFAKIEPLFESAPIDHAAVLAVLQEEIEVCRLVLAEADFMEAKPDSSEPQI